MAMGCYRREERAYKPHLTLGRVSGQADADAIAAALKKFDGWEGGQSLVREVLVMSSELKAVGPEYTILSRAKLSA